jgi:hypothetical protein
MAESERNLTELLLRLVAAIRRRLPHVEVVKDDELLVTFDVPRWVRRYRQPSLPGWTRRGWGWGRGGKHDGRF